MKVVLVVGPPRSCTSVTARILHEKLGVCMGHDLVPGNAGNPLGFYEDFKYVGLIKERKVWNLLSVLDHGCEYVGVKSPELAYVNLEVLNPWKVVRTRRPLAGIAASLVNWHQPRLDVPQALQLAKHYESAITAGMTCIPPWNRYDIFYNNGIRDEESIEQELRQALSL